MTADGQESHQHGAGSSNDVPLGVEPPATYHSALQAHHINQSHISHACKLSESRMFHLVDMLPVHLFLRNVM